MPKRRNATASTLIEESYLLCEERDLGNEDGQNEYQESTLENETNEIMIAEAYASSQQQFTLFAHLEANKLQKLAEEKSRDKKPRSVSPLLYRTLNETALAQFSAIAKALNNGETEFHEFDQKLLERPGSH